MGEYYIRQQEGGEIRGPFDEDQMTSLADAGKITLETQVADETKTDWFVVGESEELKAFLFPERKKIGLKKDHGEGSFQKLNTAEDEAKPAITVEQMLAAAEGHTEETTHLKQRQQKMEKAAGLALPVLTVMMVLSGLANSLPRYQVIIDLFSGKFEGLIQQPFALVGLFDLILAFGLFLKIFSLMPLVRFRAMLGLGFFLMTYWSLGDTAAMIASVCAGLGLFICSITLDLMVMIAFALIGVGGMGYLAWTAWSAVSAAAG